MDESQKLDEKGLREFGLLTGIILAVLFGLLLPWQRSYSLPLWPWIVSAILWFLAFLVPGILNPVYEVWMRIGSVLSWINIRLILGIVFYFLIMPIGLLMRGVFHQDPMARKLDADLKTYRITSQRKSRESMEKPF